MKYRKITFILASALLLAGCSKTASTGPVGISPEASAEMTAPAKVPDVAATDFLGDWRCENVLLSIRQVNGVYIGLLYWMESSEVYEEWEYPLHFQDGKLVCSGDGSKYDVDESKPSEYQHQPPFTATYANQSAEFSMTKDGVIWDDLDGNRGDGMVFAFVQTED